MSTTVTEPPKKEAKENIASPVDVRWCPGCGDYVILNAIKKVFPELGVSRENFVVVSGIGCSSRFPYYVNTYGFHTIHGRAPTVATGVKVSNPDLSVWMVTGDGDALSIGGNHMLHLLRRNVDINVMLFNNHVYGLTKGQYSPTSNVGMKTKSSPMGSIDYPVDPIRFALGCGATFVARASDTNQKHMIEVFKAAHAHKGVSFIEIFQNCVIFNDKTWEPVTGRENRAEQTVLLEEGKPLVFGAERNKGIRLNGLDPEIVNLGEDGVSSEDEVLVHDPKAASFSYANLLASMSYPDFPTPLGVFRQIEAETYENAVTNQIDLAKSKQGEGDLQELLIGADSWVVE
tara:strand:+ start:1233 stop:2267 length:1035 start_codon:yes stop_codon:yes gene_type:complete